MNLILLSSHKGGKKSGYAQFSDLLNISFIDLLA